MLPGWFLACALASLAMAGGAWSGAHGHDLLSTAHDRPVHLHACYVAAPTSEAAFLERYARHTGLASRTSPRRDRRRIGPVPSAYEAHLLASFVDGARVTCSGPFGAPPKHVPQAVRARRRELADDGLRPGPTATLRHDGLRVWRIRLEDRRGHARRDVFLVEGDGAWTRIGTIEHWPDSPWQQPRGLALHPGVATTTVLQLRQKARGTGGKTESWRIRRYGRDGDEVGERSVEALEVTAVPDAAHRRHVTLTVRRAMGGPLGLSWRRYRMKAEVPADAPAPLAADASSAIPLENVRFRELGP